MPGRVIAAAFAGFQLMVRRPAAAAVWIGISALLALVSYGVQTWANATVGVVTANRRFPPMFDAHVWPVMVPMLIAMVALNIIVISAVNRAILRPSASTFAYLRLGRDELNLLGIGLVIVVAILVYFITVFVGFVMLRSIGVPPSLIVLLPLGLVLFIWPRLVLMMATTIGRGRFAFSEAWDLGGDHYWPLLGMCVVNFILAVLLIWVQSLILRVMPPLASLPARLGAYLPIALLAGVANVVIYAPGAAALLVLKARPVDQAAVFD